MANHESQTSLGQRIKQRLNEAANSKANFARQRRKEHLRDGNPMRAFGNIYTATFSELLADATGGRKASTQKS